MDRTLTPQVSGELRYALHRVYLHAAGQGGLCRRVGGHIQRVDTGPLSSQSHGEHTGHGPELPRQRELSDKGRVRGRGAELSPGRQDTDQNGEIVPRAPFFSVGGSQIYCNAGDWKGEAAVFHCGPNPIPRLLDRRIRQSHNIKVGQASRQVALGGDLIPSNPADPQRAYLAEQVRPSSHHIRCAV